MREREPSLGNVVGGILYPESSWCDPYLFVRHLAERVRNHGGTVHTQRAARRITFAGPRATGVETNEGHLAADTVLVAAGSETGRLLASTSCSLPLQPAKGYHRDYPHGKGVPALRLPCILGESYVFCTPIADHLRLAGTLEFSGFNLDVRRERLEQLSRAAELYYRDVDLPAPSSEWVGPTTMFARRLAGTWLGTRPPGTRHCHRPRDDGPHARSRDRPAHGSNPAG